MHLRGALLVVASMALAIRAAKTSIFVSPSGSDVSGDGSMSNPFASVVRAQTAVRRINVGMNDDIFVYLREGQYFLDSTVDLTPADNGFNGFRVRYEAYNGEEVLLHGGVQVTGWRQVPGSNIWTAPLPAGISDTRQVYINGDRMQPTNTGAGIPGTVTITSDGYTTTDPLNTYFAPNQDPSDIEYLYTGVGSSWTECRVRVAAVSRNQGITRITMEQPAFQLARNRFYGQGVDKPASVSNIYALLGASSPGKYYFNTAQRTIYYVPRAKDNMTSAVVIVPKTEVLLRATGQQDADRPVANLTFHGLTFAYAGWLEPNQGLGYVDLQSGFRMLPSSTANDTTWVPVPGNVQFHTAEFINITNCTFAHLGATALMVDQGSQNIVIQSNIFTDVSGGGVYVGQVNDVNVTDPTRENSHFLIDDNLFDGIPVEYRDCAAILGGFMLDTNITHNSILNTPNTGISLGWGWSRDQAQNAGWNNILANYVYGSNWLLEDGGSLYVLGPQPYSTMGSNYVSNQKKLFGALYTDEGSAYWHITLNVINDCPEWLHIWTESIHDELVDFCWSNQQYQDVHGTRIVIKNITFIDPGAPFPPAAQAIISAAGTVAMAGPKP